MASRSRRMAPLMIAFALLLAGCGRAELYGKLTETQANEMIAVLQNAGIDADKSGSGEGQWSVATSKASFPEAIATLRAQGLPREEFASLGTVFKKEGFVSSPVEEHARLIYGLSQELSHTVSEIDGVVQARVHLSIPVKEPMAEAVKPSSASVFIKYRPGVALDKQVGKVKALVVNSVEGMVYDNVTVVTFPAQPLPAPDQRFAASTMVASMQGLAVPIVLAMLALVGYPAYRRWRMRRRASVPATQGDAG